MNFRIEIEQETDGRWIAEASGLFGALACGESRERAILRSFARRIANVQALALRVLADRIE